MIQKGLSFIGVNVMPWRSALLVLVIAIFIISGFFEAEPQTPQTTAKYGTEALYVSAADKPGDASADVEIIAHCGANHVFDEHTLTADKIASKAEADSIEIDLRMTKDHELIAFHDTTLDCTATEAVAPKEFRRSGIKQFDTATMFGQETYKDSVTTLDEIFAAFGQEAHYYMETRLVDGDTKMEEPLINLLQENNLLDPKYVSIQSFSKESLQKIQEFAPEIRTTLLYETDKFDLEDALEADADVIGIESRNVTQDVVDALQQEGIEVHVFFTEERTELIEQQRVIMYGVDGVFTDDIDFTRQVIKQ